MTTPNIGYGLTVEVEDAPASGVFVELAQVFSATPPSAEVDDVETTHYGSPDRSREFIAGLTDRGEVSIEMNFEEQSATDGFIRAWRSSGLNRAVRITYANGAIVNFAAYVKTYNPNLPLDDRMTAALMLKVTGQVTHVAVAAPTNTLRPAISGVAQVGQTLTALNGTWTGAPTFSYQWQADTAGNGTYANITGATSRTYVLAVGEQGDSVRVAVTGTNSAGSATANSVGTSLVAAA
jgi:hypothetical protein